MHSEYLISAELLDQSMKSRPYNIYPATMKQKCASSTEQDQHYEESNPSEL